MKKFSKYLRQISLTSVILYGFCGLENHAQASTAEEAKEKTEQLKENLKIAESLRVYGESNLKGAYSINNYPAKSSFTPAGITKDDEASPNSKFIFDLDTKLGLEKKAKLNNNDILFVMEIGFNKEGKGSVKRASAEFKNWLVGLKVSNFCNPELLPTMLGGLPNSALMAKAIQIKWQQKINANYSYAISLEEAPKLDLYPSQKDAEKKKKDDNQPNNDLPAITGNLRYNYPNALGHIQLGGLARMLECYNKATKKSATAAGLGINLGTQFNIDPKKTIFKSSIVYGQGIGGYMGDLSSLTEEVNTAYIKTGTNDLITIKALGMYLGLEQHWNPVVRSTFSGGFLTTIDNTDRLTSAYKAGFYGSLNLTYHPTEQFHFGVEYLHGNRMDLDDKSVQANYIQTIASFTF